MKKALITGASGMLGSNIAHAIQEMKDHFDVTGTGRKNIQPDFSYYQADLLKENELKELLLHVNPDIIIHCAANVDLNDCEINHENADKLNVEVSKTLASFNPGKCKIIYVSTDSIFDGSKGNYSEKDEPAPLNYYASSKLKGEQLVLQSNSNSLILRTNIYGFHKYGEDNSLFEWVYKNLISKKSLTGFSDIYFNPLYTGQLSEIIIYLLLNDTTGLLHLGCKEKISKYDFALQVADTFGLKKSLIQKGESRIMNSVVKRPKNTTLNTSKADTLVSKEYNFNDGMEKLKNDFLLLKICYS